ncbi:protein ANTAGONIST OF LIKE HETEROCHROMATIN PROTEIN 1 [Venturia canescens]|uniref:protein ANTAGONIST OF LIKE HETEROCHROMATIN PROTEIN 1 n=1 Tax=Venturia canescens TaxID=32260 RepID=UPI001C9C00C5|nr:protein ANTAGONIST OF LIKE HETEROCHROMATIN PROTEIN 1 [Venturia canescens]
MRMRQAEAVTNVSRRGIIILPEDIRGKLRQLFGNAPVHSGHSKMEDTNVAVACASFITIYSLLKKNKKVKNKRRWWSLQLYLKRKTEMTTSMLKDLRVEEKSGQFKNFTRMSNSDFNFILNSIKDKISKNDTVFRKAVSPEERLAVTLRFLATGDSFTSLQYLFKISKQLISKIIPDVCRAIIDCLKDYMKMPSTADEWKSIADTFDEKWNFPNCMGAVDGKHIILQAPINSASEFYNYKSQFSIVLMAVVDADYNFIFVNVGAQGRISDGGVFRNCELFKELEKGNLNFPKPSALYGRKIKVPCVLLGDAAFPLHEHIMKPYSGTHPIGSPKRIFNYRLSRARRVVENAFGIAASVFRVLRKPMLLQPEKAELIVMTVVSLHNFLRRSQTSRNIYTPIGFTDIIQNGEIITGCWRNDQQGMLSLLPIQNVPRRTKRFPQQIREEFTEYFCTCGSLPWQNNYT